MPPLATAFVRIRPDLSTFRNDAATGLKGARLDRLGQSAGESASKGFKRGFSGVFTVAKMAAPALAAVFGGTVLTSGIKYVANLEQANTAFTTMLGSAAKATAMVSKLQAFAATTPFNFPDLVTASQKLIAFGFTAQQIIPTLTAVGDAAAGLGLGAEGVDRITTAIGQMLAKTRIQSDEILQLTEAGVPALRILANQYGVSAKKMQEMITAGVVTSNKAIPLLLKGLEKGTKGAAGATTAFGGMMAKQSKTLTGLWSNFVDNANMRLGQLVTPAMPAIKAALTGMSDLISGKGAIAGKIKAAFGAIDFRALLSTLRTIGTGLYRAFGPAVIGFLRRFGTFLGQLWSGFQNLRAFIQPVIRLLAQVAGAAVIAGFQVLGVLLSTVIGPAFRALTGFLRDNQTVFLAVGAAVMTVVVAMNLWRAGLAIYIIMTKSISIVTRAWAAVQWLLNVALSANPIGLIVIAIAALAAAFAVVWQRSETFRRIVTGALNAVKGAIMAALNWVRANWPLLLAILTGPIGLAVLWIVRHWDTVKNAFKTAIQAIRNAFASFVNYILGIFGWIINGAAKAFGWIPGIGPKLRAAANTFNTFRDNVNAAITGIHDRTVTVGISMSSYHFNAAGYVIGGKALGGPIRGPGGPRDDRAGLYALSDNEYVMQASAHQRYGTAFMDALNAGRLALGGVAGGIRRLATGGPAKSGVGLSPRVPPEGTIRTGVGSAANAVIQSMANAVASVVARALNAIGAGGGAIANYARQFLGVPYVWGGTTPAGWDCSGATSYWYRHFGYNIPRTSQAQQLWARPSGDVPGALVFFYGGNGTASHVGLNLGGGKMINAYGTGYGTIISPSRMAGFSGFGIPPGGFHMARGGVIREPVVGVGKSGRSYTFGEAGTETVTSAGDIATQIALLRRIAATLENAPARTGNAMGSALDGVARRAGQKRYYGG